MILLQPSTAAIKVDGSPTSPITISTDVGSMSTTSWLAFLTNAYNPHNNNNNNNKTLILFTSSAINSRIEANKTA